MFKLSQTDIDINILKASLLDAKAGAYVSFEGWVRNTNDSRHVLQLEYQAYETLALKEGAKILEEAQTRFGIDGAACVHRTGSLQVSEVAVWIGVTSEHRQEAFEACRYIIDEIKRRLPIWKKETYTDGSSGWVNCRQHAHAEEINQEVAVS